MTPVGGEGVDFLLINLLGSHDARDMFNSHAKRVFTLFQDISSTKRVWHYDDFLKNDDGFRTSTMMYKI